MATPTSSTSGYQSAVDAANAAFKKGLSDTFDASRSKLQKGLTPEEQSALDASLAAQRARLTSTLSDIEGGYKFAQDANQTIAANSAAQQAAAARALIEATRSQLGNFGSTSTPGANPGVVNASVADAQRLAGQNAAANLAYIGGEAAVPTGNVYSPLQTAMTQNTLGGMPIGGTAGNAGLSQQRGDLFSQALNAAQAGGLSAARTASETGISNAEQNALQAAIDRYSKQASDLENAYLAAQAQGAIQTLQGTQSVGQAAFNAAESAKARANAIEIQRLQNAGYAARQTGDTNVDQTQINSVYSQSGQNTVGYGKGMLYAANNPTITIKTGVGTTKPLNTDLKTSDVVWRMSVALGKAVSYGNDINAARGALDLYLGELQSKNPVEYLALSAIVNGSQSKPVSSDQLLKLARFTTAADLLPGGALGSKVASITPPKPTTKSTTKTPTPTPNPKPTPKK